MSASPPRQYNDNQNKPQCWDIIKRIPFASLFLYVGLIFVWFADIFTDLGSLFLPNVYKDTVYSYQIWRLFTSLFVGQSLFMIFLIILNFQTFLPMIENKKGTTFTLLHLFITNFKLQLVLLFLEYAISKFMPRQSPLNGIYCVWFYLMTIFCWLNPKIMKFCGLPIKFNRIYFPIIFTAVIFILRWQMQLDIVVGIVLGLFQSTVLRNKGQLLKLNHYQNVEQIFDKMKLTKLSNWKKLDTSRFIQNNLCTQNIYTNLENEQNQYLNENEDHRSTNISDQNNNNDPFANKKGIRLSDY